MEVIVLSCGFSIEISLSSGLLPGGTRQKEMSVLGMDPECGKSARTYSSLSVIKATSQGDGDRGPSSASFSTSFFS